MSKKNIALDRLLTIQNHISNQPQQTGPIDLARERENASFNVKHMNWLFWGNKEFAEALQDAFLIIQRDPELHFSGGHPFDLTRPEEREATMKQIFRYIQLKKSLKDPLLFKALGVAMGMYSESFNMKVYVNDYLMAQSFKLFGTTEQCDAYINDIVNWKVIGCFAMTELGHSSFLRGLETTATYDRETDEFIIHSPTLTATKIWIGMAGQTATHTIAICQTIIDGKKCGINWFIVQLRDQKTGKLMPGVTAGDVGAKYGRNGIDNGWIQFSHVRIPRTNMMMKWSKVNKGGEYIPSAFPAVSYSVLIGERLSVLSGAISTCGQVLTIACRYGCVRRQGANEEQIMDYQSHYVRLMPCVASTYVISVITRVIISKWEGIMKLAQTSQEEFISYLPDIHAISSGLKAAISWWGCEVLERVRRSMGGYAYSSYNGISGAIGDWGVVTTGGGDNFVLIQQAARYLLGSFKQVSHGKKVTGSVEFLNDIQQIRSSTKSILSDERQLLNLDFTLEMYTWLCCKKVDVLAASLDSSTEGEETTWNENQVDLIKLGELYSYRFTLSEYIKGIKECSTNNEFKELIPILTKLGSLWAIHLINDSLYLFLEEEYFSKEQVKMIKKCYLKLCKEIRKECIPLVDSWGFTDFMLKAPLGKYDGDVYTAYLDTLKAAPNCMGIPDYWEKYVKNF